MIKRSLEETNTNMFATYNKSFDKVHFNLMGGGDLRFENKTILNSNGTGLELDRLYTVSNIERSSLEYSSFVSSRKVFGAIGIFNIDYDNLIFLELTGRNDWSSTLPRDNRSFFYPSVSLSIIPSEFISMPSFITSLKVNGSWANVGKDTEPFMLTESADRTNWGGKTGFIVDETLLNNNLRPENITSWETGLGLDLFDNHLTFEVALYRIDDEDQIIDINVPAETGYLNSNMNAGIVRSEGVEINLFTDIIRSKNIDWSISFNASQNRTELLKLPEGVDTYRFWGRFDVYNQAKIGGSIGDLWFTDVKRVEEGKYEGMPILNDVGRPQSSSELSFYGNIINNKNIGLQNTFRYKNISLNANFDFRFGGSYYSETMARLVLDGRGESWFKGDGSSTFTGILSANSFNGDLEAIADEIRNNISKYNGVENGLTYVGGRNEELGGFYYEGSNQYNGIFFPGVFLNEENGEYIENFGGSGTVLLPIHDMNEGDAYFTKGLQSWIYDASFIKLRQLSISYAFSESIRSKIQAQNLSIAAFLNDLIIWTKAKNGIDPELGQFAPRNDVQGTRIDNYRMEYGMERQGTRPWTLNFGVKLSVGF